MGRTIQRAAANADRIPRAEGDGNAAAISILPNSNSALPNVIGNALRLPMIQNGKPSSQGFKKCSTGGWLWNPAAAPCSSAIATLDLAATATRLISRIDAPRHQQPQPTQPPKLCRKRLLTKRRPPISKLP